jgi:hypothetical protein
MRCNALPTLDNFDQRQHFATGKPVFLRPSEPCSGNWHVTVGSDASPPKIVHLTATAHNLNRIVSGERIGVKFNASATERDGIEYGFRAAAWRVYGMSMGTKLLRSFSFYNDSSCSKINGCGGAGCSICVTDQTCQSNVWTIDGYMTICNTETSVLRTNNQAAIDADWTAPGTAPAKVIAHEFGHQWMAQPDEYWNDPPCTSGIVGQSIGLCGHTLMERSDFNRQGLCNDDNHRGHVEDRRNGSSSWNRILGPVGFQCTNGAAIWVDAQSGWSRWSQGVPQGAIPAFSPQNLDYIRQGFGVKTSLGEGTFQ